MATHSPRAIVNETPSSAATRLRLRRSRRTNSLRRSTTATAAGPLLPRDERVLLRTDEADKHAPWIAVKNGTRAHYCLDRQGGTGSFAIRNMSGRGYGSSCRLASIPPARDARSVLGADSGGEGRRRNERLRDLGRSAPRAVAPLAVDTGSALRAGMRACGVLALPAADRDRRRPRGSVARQARRARAGADLARQPRAQPPSPVDAEGASDPRPKRRSAREPCSEERVHRRDQPRAWHGLRRLSRRPGDLPPYRGSRRGRRRPLRQH